MSTKGEQLYHPLNGSVEETWNGFSWPAFLFGIIWLAIKGLWGHAVVNLIIVVMSGGIAAPFVWIAYGFIGNDVYKKSLLKKGYLTADQNLSRAAPSPVAPAFRVDAQPIASSPSQPLKDPIERLRELADLKQKGFLTEDEFNAQKAKLLAV